MMMRSLGMIRCEEALSRLWEFLDGELPPADETAVKRHLEVCNRCYPHYDFRRAYFEYARQVREREQAPASLRRELFRRILEQESAEDGEP